MSRIVDRHISTLNKQLYKNQGKNINHKTKSLFKDQRKLALKVVNASVTGHTWGLKQSKTGNYMNNLTGDFDKVDLVNDNHQYLWNTEHVLRDHELGDFILIPK